MLWFNYFCHSGQHWDAHTSLSLFSFRYPYLMLILQKIRSIPQIPCNICHCCKGVSGHWGVISYQCVHSFTMFSVFLHWWQQVLNAYSLKYTVLSRCIPTISNIFSHCCEDRRWERKSNIYMKISIHALSAYLLTVVVPKAQQRHKGTADNLVLSRRCKRKTIHGTSDYRSIWPSIPTMILTDKGRIGRRK